MLTKRNTFAFINISIPTDDFVDVINHFAKEFDDSATSIIVHFTGEKRSYISEIITTWGLCFTFNMAFSHDLLNLNVTSDDFHYQLFLESTIYNTINPPPVFLPRSSPSSNAGLTIEIYSSTLEYDEIIFNDFRGFIVMVHDPFELPSKKSKLLRLGYDRNLKVIIDAQMNKIDESVSNYEPVE